MGSQKPKVKSSRTKLFASGFWLPAFGFLLLAFCFAPPALALDSNPLTAPNLQIPVPGVSLSKPLLVAGKLSAPYLAQYIAGVYAFLLSIVGVVAGVSIIYGGFLWMTSGGAADRAKKGKKRISDAVIGMALAYGSYLILYLINPSTVNFSSFNFIAVTTETADFNQDFDPETQPIPGGAGTGATTYDTLFVKYAPCAGVDWRVLKAIAVNESSLDPNLVNRSGYTGLFQTKPATCQSVLSGTTLASKCNTLTDPEVNTAVGAMLLKNAVSIIQARCSTATLQDQFTMLYINHNMGSGVLRYATNKGCDAATLRQAVIDYYANIGTATATSYANKYQQACLSSGKSAAECTGGPKFDYAQKTALTMANFGVTSLTSTSGGSCPIQ